MNHSRRTIKERLCPKCKNRRAKRGLCPYEEDLHSRKKLCYCCDECRKACAEEL